MYYNGQQSISRVEAERNQVDAHLASESLTGAQIMKLKTERNKLAAISSLPNELFCNIFVECKEGWTGDDGSSLAWRAITQVCSQWREIALDCPELWSQLNSFVSPRWLEAMVARSKDAPLFIRLVERSLDTSMTELLSYALFQAHRLREVSLKGDAAFLVSFLDSFTSSPGPLLNEFSIVNTDAEIPQSSNNVIFLPDQFLDGNAPRLRRLELVWAYLPWTSNVFNRLTTLRIRLPRPSGHVPVPDPDRFLHILATMPQLTHLDLNMQLPDMGDLTSRRRVPPISLPSLKHLRLVSTCKGCAGLLRYLHIPISTIVRVHGTEADENYVVALMSSLSSAWLSSPLQSRDLGDRTHHLRALRIVETVRGMIDVQGYDRDVKDLGARDDREHAFCLTLRECRDFNLAAIVMCALPLQNLVSMDLDCPFNGVEAWRAILAPLTALRFISLYPQTAKSVLAILLDRHPAEGMYLPMLESISLHRVVIHDMAQMKKRTPNMLSPAYLYEAGAPLGIFISDMDCLLGFRMRVGRKLKSLRLVHCSGIRTWAEVDILDRIVDEVYWEGDALTGVRLLTVFGAKQLVSTWSRISKAGHIDCIDCEYDYLTTRRV